MTRWMVSEELLKCSNFELEHDLHKVDEWKMERLEEFVAAAVHWHGHAVVLRPPHLLPRLLLCGRTILLQELQLELLMLRRLAQ